MKSFGLAVIANIPTPSVIYWFRRLDVTPWYRCAECQFAWHSPRSPDSGGAWTAQANRGGDRNGGCGRYRGGKATSSARRTRAGQRDRERHGVRAVGRWATHRPVDSRRPGQRVPAGSSAAMQGMQFKALIEAGFNGLAGHPAAQHAAGHSVADMADDYARLIADQFGGRVEWSWASPTAG